ncbi:MAG: DUF6240 domain-containing protein [Lachnospiraceae bacterium]|nr:DUF6240 domain-containing protein [Lachnospiraceae bacterium]
MKITFDQGNTNQNVDRATTAYRNTQMPQTERMSDYALDISGTVMDNNAYKGHGKTAEEVMQDAGLIDVATQRDYMTVMSNSMSEEDFSRLQKEGYHPGDMDIEEVVTIVDQIKAELVKGGTQVVGYTDDLDAETLCAITGSEAFARELEKQFREHDIPVTRENVNAAKQAYDKASQLETPEDGAVKYMIENRLEPTIDHLYLADHSAAGSNPQSHGYYATDNTGYYAKKAEDYNWQQLKPQMEKVLEEAGIDITEESINEAKWLVEAGIPLTEETVSRLHEIEKVALPQDMQQILSAVAAAISDGKSAGSANLADGRSNREKAADYVDAFAKISEEAVDQTAAEGKELTLRHLEQTQKQIDQSGLTEGTPEQISARRQLEEVRLMMTIEANRKLIESGYSIDTTELEKLVEALKKIEQEQNQVLFSESDSAAAADKASLFAEVQQKTAEIPLLPAAVLAEYLFEEVSFTLDSVYTHGTALKNAYDAAKESYETLMTAPRSDMGDSIRKAFRNVDDILQDMDMETSEENRRAVRILGYNSMDITEDNMDAVKKYDMELRQTIRKMTPAATLQAIRDGKNPLNMSIEELNRYLDENGHTEAVKEEKFSKYLYKLEQNHAIDEQEREAYIGIYRMFRQLEKTDDAAVGSLLKEGAQLSFQNLITAMRSTKKQGMDYTIDDQFNGVNGVTVGKSITDQILSGFPDLAGQSGDGRSRNGQPGADSEAATRYYSQLAGEIADTLEPEMLMQMTIEPDTTMEEFMDQIYGMQPDGQLEMAYEQEQLQQYRALNTVENAVINELLAYQQTITADHLSAAMSMRKNPGFLHRKLNELDHSADKHIVKDAIRDMVEGLTDKDTAADAYDNMQETFTGLIEDAKASEDITYLDLRALQNCQKQLALAGNLAKEENYQIPVEVHGELTAINLKILHGSEGGKVSALMQTEEYGQVAASFFVRNHTISGYIACDTDYGTKELQGKEDDLKDAFAQISVMKEEPLKVGSIGIVHSTEMNAERYIREDLENNTQVETVDLYRIAKAVITIVTA